MEAYYSFVVTTDDGSVNRVYGEWVEWVIPARPYINVNTVQPGYNEMTVTLDTEPYEVYLESVDGSTVIYDADDGAVDGRIHGLTEGTEYIVYFRVPPTEDSFASPQYYLVETFTTLTRTRLSVEAAETSWEWQPGFSLGGGGLLSRCRSPCRARRRCRKRANSFSPPPRMAGRFPSRSPSRAPIPSPPAFRRTWRTIMCWTIPASPLSSARGARDRQPGHHRAAHSGTDVYGRAIYPRCPCGMEQPNS